MTAGTAAQHTPGPWQFIDGGAYFEIHHQDTQAEPGALALVCWADEEDKATEAIANARLISQSPRLLKTAMDLWHANAAEGPDRDEMLIASAWAELIDAIEAADGSRP